MVRSRPLLKESILLPATQGNSANIKTSYGETLYPKINMGWAELRSMRTARWKYIRAPKSELYDLQKDPAGTQECDPRASSGGKRVGEQTWRR